MSISENGDLIINEQLVFQVISLSHTAIDVEKIQSYKEEITKSLSKYITVS